MLSISRQIYVESWLHVSDKGLWLLPVSEETAIAFQYCKNGSAVGIEIQQDHSENWTIKTWVRKQRLYDQLRASTKSVLSANS